jgi:hypothetical protein
MSHAATVACAVGARAGQGSSTEGQAASLAAERRQQHSTKVPQGAPERPNLDGGRPAGSAILATEACLEQVAALISAAERIEASLSVESAVVEDLKVQIARIRSSKVVDIGLLRRSEMRLVGDVRENRERLTLIKASIEDARRIAARADAAALTAQRAA